MHYSIKQLSNQRWGIYWESKLLATFGCYEKCLAILKVLQTNSGVRSRVSSASERGRSTFSTQATLEQKTGASEDKAAA